MTYQKPDYICVLDSGCSSKGHSLNCQEKNKKYAEAWMACERRKREAEMDAVINDDRD